MFKNLLRAILKNQEYGNGKLSYELANALYFREWERGLYW